MQRLGDDLTSKRQKLQSCTKPWSRLLNCQSTATSRPASASFDVFALAYRKNHPDVRANMTCIVRQMQTMAGGAASARTRCTRSTNEFRGIFAYLLKVLPEFGLSLYKQPTGNEMQVRPEARTTLQPMPRCL